MKKKFITLFIALLSLYFLQAQKTSSPAEMRQMIDDDLRFAVQQYKVMRQHLAADSMPRSYNPRTDKFISSDIGWWCSGFYSASLWYLYEYSKDENIRKEAERALTVIKPNENNKGTHDLGFMMYCSFGNAYRITKKQAYKEVIFQSAKSLSTRYRPSIKVIQSWDSSANFRCPVIIDNMMNLELLEWVSHNGGDKLFEDIAITHANTTMKNHYRPDYSSYHVLDYNMAAGNVSRKITAQGAADSSAWARGQSWGLYGYITMYRFTKDKTYLEQARHIASFILNNPNFPADGIPYWDFDAPGIPDTYRDASAGAILSSALLELAQYVNGEEKNKYVHTAEKILQTLSSDIYRAKAGSNGGFVLMHSVGHLPAKSEIDVPLSYADYYFIEALMRYKKWYLK